MTNTTNPYRFWVMIYLFMGMSFLWGNRNCLAQTNLNVPNNLLDNDEGEIKLTIPEGQEKVLWRYLNETLNTEVLQNIDSSLSTKNGQENIVDTYYDNDMQTLLSQWAGIRHRAIYKKDTLFKSYTLLKSSGYAQQAVKQKLAAYAPKEPNDTKKTHDFWQHIPPNDRPKVNAFLLPMNTEGDLLHPILNIQQKRNRIFVYEDKQRILTVTLDTIESAIFPYTSFAELEIEITPYAPSKPWVRSKELQTRAIYRAGKVPLLKEFLAKKIESELSIRFPDLVKDATPKYNKLTQMLHNNWIATVYTYVIPFLVGSLFVSVVYYLFKI
ncbi:MAG: hypothetical protein ACPGXL_07395 [Chitinophagales bacterium]